MFFFFTPFAFIMGVFSDYSMKKFFKIINLVLFIYVTNLKVQIIIPQI